MCDCKEQIESKLLAWLIKQEPEGKEHKMSLLGYGVVFQEETLIEKPFMECEASYVRQQKNGKLRIRKGVNKVFFSFCPFCGLKLEQEDGMPI